MQKKPFACYRVDAASTNRLGKFVNDTTKIYAKTKMHQIEISGILRLISVIFSKKLKSDMTIKHLACGGEKP